MAEQTGQLQVTYRPTFCVAHGKLKDEKQAGVVKKKKNPLKFTNGGRERRPGDREGGGGLSISPKPSKLSSPHMASTPQGTHAIPNRPAATVPSAPYGDNFQTLSATGDICPLKVLLFNINF